MNTSNNLLFLVHPMTDFSGMPDYLDAFVAPPQSQCTRMSEISSAETLRFQTSFAKTAGSKQHSLSHSLKPAREFTGSSSGRVLLSLGLAASKFTIKLSAFACCIFHLKGLPLFALALTPPS